MRFKARHAAPRRNLVLAAILLAALAACAEPQTPLGQCEPGVGGLSGLGTAAPGTC